jgi:hypothetical protein
MHAWYVYMYVFMYVCVYYTYSHHTCIHAYAQDTFGDILQTMTDRWMEHVWVVNDEDEEEKDHPIGLLTISDVLQFICQLDCF